jgi:hypothetical protein
VSAEEAEMESAENVAIFLSAGRKRTEALHKVVKSVEIFNLETEFRESKERTTQ